MRKVLGKWKRLQLRATRATLFVRSVGGFSKIDDHFAHILALVHVVNGIWNSPNADERSWVKSNCQQAFGVKLDERREVLWNGLGEVGQEKAANCR